MPDKARKLTKGMRNILDRIMDKCVIVGFNERWIWGDTGELLPWNSDIIHSMREGGWLEIKSKVFAGELAVGWIAIPTPAGRRALKEG